MGTFSGVTDGGSFSFHGVTEWGTRWPRANARGTSRGRHCPPNRGPSGEAGERLHNLYGGVVLRVSRGSDIEADVQDVAILDPVIPAFEAEEPLIPNAFL
jgi:hypothetical protein